MYMPPSELLNSGESHWTVPISSTFLHPTKCGILLKKPLYPPDMHTFVVKSNLPTTLSFQNLAFLPFLTSHHSPSCKSSELHTSPCQTDESRYLGMKSTVPSSLMPYLLGITLHHYPPAMITLQPSLANRALFIIFALLSPIPPLFASTQSLPTQEVYSSSPLSEPHTH